MMGLLHWLLSAAAILVTAYFVPGVETSVIGAFLLAAVLGVINISIKPVVSFITLPLTIITLGLFSLVVNVAFIMLADFIVPGFSLSGIWVALVFSIVLSLVNAIFRFGLPK